MLIEKQEHGDTENVTTMTTQIISLPLIKCIHPTNQMANNYNRQSHSYHTSTSQPVTSFDEKLVTKHKTYNKQNKEAIIQIHKTTQSFKVIQSHVNIPLRMMMAVDPYFIRAATQLLTFEVCQTSVA